MSPVTSRPGPRHPVKRSATHTCELPANIHSSPRPGVKSLPLPVDMGLGHMTCFDHWEVAVSDAGGSGPGPPKDQLRPFLYSFFFSLCSTWGAPGGLAGVTETHDGGAWDP